MRCHDGEEQKQTIWHTGASGMQAWTPWHWGLASCLRKMQVRVRSLSRCKKPLLSVDHWGSSTAREILSFPSAAARPFNSRVEGLWSLCQYMWLHSTLHLLYRNLLVMAAHVWVHNTMQFLRGPFPTSMYHRRPISATQQHDRTRLVCTCTPQLRCKEPPSIWYQSNCAGTSCVIRHEVARNI